MSLRRLKDGNRQSRDRSVVSDEIKTMDPLQCQRCVRCDDVMIVMVSAYVIAETMKCWEDLADAVVRLSISGFELAGVWKQKRRLRYEDQVGERVNVSALALLKMVVDARSGGTIEVMGLMQGKTDGDAIIVMDIVALPVEGTKTRFNDQANAYDYMVDYSQTNMQGVKG
ncbi:hypothetical protein Scep_006786 [Stephania cephalantha]|uniref:JAB1/MPN/MOV34 metalloenzyme domain-containing protein n=1 Tax=Stephania cephalantha TaxID=152367 RepID=A0AAP0PMK1_9MAGN